MSETRITCTTKPKFFKMMLGDFENELRMPRKFVKDFGEQLSNRCILRGPGGNDWKVRVRRVEENVFFTRGWDNFIRDHSVQEYDFLVFSFKGGSRFNVSVFDSSGCESEAAYIPKMDVLESDKNENVIIEVEESDSEVFGRGYSRKRARRSHYNDVFKGKSKVDHLVQYDSFSDTDDGNDDDDYDKEEEEEEEEEAYVYRPQISKLARKGGHSVKQAQKCLISSRREVTEQEKRRAHTRADDYIKRAKGNGVPMVGIIMLRTHVYKGLYLTIPKEWAKKNMIKDDHEVELRVPRSDEYWLVGCRWSLLGQCQLRPRWAEFVLDNNLEEGDVCVFELIHKGRRRRTRPVFKVQIFRVVSRLVPLISKRMTV